MGEQEQHAIVGQTALEHSEAKRKLAMLESKARSCANHMRIVAHELHPSNLTPQSDHSRDIFKNALDKCLSKDEILSLLEDTETTKKRVEELSKALSAMGV